MNRRGYLLLAFIVAPYLARIPGVVFHGPSWLLQYFDAGVISLLLIQALNALPGAILAAASYGLSGRGLAIPSALTAGFVLFSHGCLDLASDAQVAVALFAIPLFAGALALITSIITGVCVELMWKKNSDERRGAPGGKSD